MNEPLLVSIAIPAFNPEFFRGTLLSALSQDYPHLEVVVCDYSSGPQIEAICEQRGKTFQVNLWADDTRIPQCISRQAKVLQENE